MKHSRWIGLGLVALACLALTAQAAHKKGAAPVTDDSLTRLKEGNQRYLMNATRAAERAATAQDQSPYAIVLTCADSRVAPEILFDESLGQLFVVRVAGNVVDSDVLGSIEYAVEHLHSHFLVVLGHESCGAVKAAIDGGTLPPDIAGLVAKISPAVDVAKSQKLDAAGTLAAAARENALLQSRQAIAQSEVLAGFVKQGELKVSAAVYHLDTGKVEWLDAGK